MQTTIFFGHLNRDTTADDLRVLVAVHAEVVAANKVEGSRIGFVQTINQAAAEKVVRALHNTKMAGRTLVVELGERIR